MSTSKKSPKSSKIIRKRTRSALSNRLKNDKEQTSHLDLISESASPSVTSESEISTKKQQIDYQEEVTMILFRSMLNIIVENWEIISSEDLEPSISAETIKIGDVNDVSDTELKSFDLSSTVLEPKSSLRKNEDTSQILAITSFHKSSIEDESTRKSLENQVVDSTLSWRLEEESSVSKLKTSSSHLNFENVKVTFKNGNYYQGPIKNILFHGIGKFVWTDGAQYEGEFENGQITGKGTLVYPDLSYYQGNFCKGSLNGKGIKFIHSSLMLYNGEWKAGKKHGTGRSTGNRINLYMKNYTQAISEILILGKGWLLYQSGHWYDGEWAFDLYDGQGSRRYNSHEAYEGKWVKGMRHGTGTMVWKNRDVYIGEWKNGLMDGYGEYTWKAILSRNLAFPITNTYKGSWLQGMRDGAGIMDFGLEGGAKLAGVWQCNFKHGPGIFLCGNGKTVDGNPLFVFDKPASTQSAHIYKKFFVSDTSHVEENDKNKLPSSEKSSPNNNSLPEEKIETTIQNISQTMYQKRCGGNINQNMTIIMKDFGKYFQSKNESNYIVNINFNAPPEKIDIEYYLTFLNKEYSHISLNTSHKKSQEKVSDVHVTSVTDVTKWACSMTTENKSLNFMQKNMNSEETKLELNKISNDLEEQLLRDNIMRRMLSVKKVYNYYATLTVRRKIKYKVVLVRLLLWQFFRDIGLLNYGYSIDELDNILAENESCNFETNHNPFEKIYLWQFLHVIITLALEFYLVKLKSKFDPKIGILNTIFSKFLDEIILPQFGMSKAPCLFEYRDVLPIKSVYLLYRSFGESKTVRDFLLLTCTRKNEVPPCYFSSQKEITNFKISKGYNSSSVGDDIIFIKEAEPICEVDEEFIPVVSDPEFQDRMIIFRLLGLKKVRKCLGEICPHVVKDDIITNVHYPLSFIEFYNLLIQCAYTWIRNIKNKEKQFTSQENNTSKEKNYHYNSPIISSTNIKKK